MSTSAYLPATLLSIAETYGTPTYVYREQTIRERIDALRTHLEGVPVRLLYAMKANHALPVLEVMRESGLGIDAVSPAELELALRMGFEPSDILYSANNMTDAEMDTAVRSGVVMNIGELSRLERFGAAHPGSDVCVRVNPQVGAGHHAHVITAGEKSKFGIPVEQMDRIRDLAAAHDLRIVGLHQHIGSGIMDTQTLWKAISVMLETARTFETLRFVNVGGGLGVPYKPEEQPLDLATFESRIVAPLRSYGATHPNPALEFRFEPGRFFTAECGVLLARVNTIKPTDARTFAGLDSGMGHLVRPAMYNAWHTVVNLSRPDGPVREYDIVGNICESADFFAKNRPVAELAEGDIVGILDTGAYGISMASTYNMRPLPAEVWIPVDGPPRLLRRRLTPEEFVTDYMTSFESGT